MLLSPPIRRLTVYAALCVLLALGLAASVVAQEETSDAPTPSGSAFLVLDGRNVGQIPFVVRPDGPRFALAPLVELLGLEMRVGPLGDMHTLIFEGQEIRVGPETTAYVVVDAEGREEVRHLPAPPVEGLAGLMVPLRFFEDVFGEALGYEFDWDFRRLELAVERRELRTLRTSLDLIHQYRVSTVEITFSARPRFRRVEVPGAVELRFPNARLELSEPWETPSDPLVQALEVGTSRIRLALVENAAAAEPRLVPPAETGAPYRLVIDVYRRRAQAEEETEEALAPVAERPGVRTIVLDPGHGGEETGAVGKGGTVEAELTLQVARRLKSRLERRLPVKVILTRDTDVNVPLDTRVATANQVKADLFVSLHFNSYYGSRARGAETFFLSREASDRVAEEVAARENAVMTAEEQAEMADLELILWDLAQSYHLAESQRFATLIQEELNLALGLRDRGVRQAPFRVLMGASMPAVLVELGFLSNPSEEEKLQSSAYLGELVDALLRAIVRFRAQIEREQIEGAEARARRETTETPGPSPGGGVP